MGKFFELLGLAGFNILIVVMLSASFLQNDAVDNYDSLTRENVTGFIETVTEISGGERDDMDTFAITTYFMNHIAEDSRFYTKINYSIPDMPKNTRTLEMGKLDFISHTLKGVESVKRYESLVDIESIAIGDDKKSADVLTVSYERGMMPVDDITGETRLVPVLGTSYCQQLITLSENHVIQMAKAECNTDISFESGF